MNAHATITTERAANAIDLHVGLRVRFRRREMRLSQQELAALAHVTFQQIQKYENGSNRVSASRLVLIARALQVPVSWFFEEIESAETVAGYRSTAFGSLLEKLTDTNGGVELAESLARLTPGQIKLVAKVAGEIAYLNALADAACEPPVKWEPSP